MVMRTGVGYMIIPCKADFVWNNTNAYQAFYINLIIGAIFSPVLIFLLPSVTLQSGVLLIERITRRTDWLANILFAGATSAFVMAITFGGTLFAWNAVSEIVLWVMTAILSIGFCMSQWFHPFVAREYRLYPTQFLRRPILVLLQIAIFMASASLLVRFGFLIDDGLRVSGCLKYISQVPTYYIPLFFQFTRVSSSAILYLIEAKA